MSGTLTHSQRADRFDLKTLYETSQLLTASLDLSFVLNNLALMAMSKLLVTRASVWLKDDEPGMYTLHACKGTAHAPVGAKLEMASGAVDNVLVNDDVPAVLAEHEVHLVAPVLFGSREIGLLCLGSKATNQPFDPAELDFIVSLVNMSSTAIHNSLIVNELREANRELDAKIQQLNTLFDISQEFNAKVDRDHVVKLLSFALMGQMLVSRHVFLMRRGNDGERFEVISSKGVQEVDVDDALSARLCEFRSQVSASAEDEDAAILARLGMELAMPIQHQGETKAVLCLGKKMSGEPYRADETEFLSALGNLAFVSIQNTYLVEEQIEKELLEEEMRLARKIQEGLQPSTLPQIEGVDLAIMAVPSRHVAGDYLDVLNLDNGRLLMAIGDVTGKGMPASLLMSNIQACLHTMLPMDLTIEEATAHMNRVITSNTGIDRFITYFHAIYHQDERRLDYVNAGHDPPILLRKDGTVEQLELGGLLLGVLDGQTYERGVVELQTGDMLALFTDGITETMSPMDEEFGTERLLEVMRAHRDRSAAEILNEIANALRAFSEVALATFDDMTMVMMRVVEV